MAIRDISVSMLKYNVKSRRPIITVFGSTEFLHSPRQTHMEHLFRLMRNSGVTQKM